MQHFFSRWKIFFQIISQHKKLFYIGLVLKMLLGTYLAGDYLVHLFSPFLKYATTQSFTGSYDYFATYGKGNEFPYPSVMLVILAIPKFLLSFFSTVDSTAVGFVDVLSVRIALLIADAVILYILLQWLKKYTKQVMLLYWLSPIFIYINYIHGQLDVIPVALLFVSLYYLFKNKFLSSCIYLALAIGCKTSIVMALPFILLYAYKTTAIAKTNFWKGILVLVVALFIINVPIFLSKGYWQMVFNNAEQTKLFATYLTIGNTNLFLIVPAIYLLLLIRFWGYWQMSRNLLLMYLGFAFGLITIFIAANQGWYYWCLPFFIYFLVKENRYARLPFIFVTVFYFLHFGLNANSDYLRVFQLIDTSFASQNNLFGYLVAKGANASLWNNIFSTLLQAAIIGFCYFIYRYGISQLKHYKMLFQPYLIGISGDSASGKTTLAKLLQQLLAPTNATVINGDDMHKWERGNANYETITHLNPKANNLHLNMLHFLQLAKGNSIHRKHYNHTTGFFDAPQKVSTPKILIFEGLHTYYLSYQKNLFDLKIFTKPTEDLRTKWKIERDIKDRGHSEEAVLQSIASRKEDATNYIVQQETDADIIVTFQQLESATALEVKCLNTYYIENIITELRKHEVEITHYYKDNYQIINCQAVLNVQTIKNVAEEFTDELEELGFGEVHWKEGYDGLLQLFIIQIIFYKMQLHTVSNLDSI